MARTFPKPLHITAYAQRGQFEHVLIQLFQISFDPLGLTQGRVPADDRAGQVLVKRMISAQTGFTFFGYNTVAERLLVSNGCGSRISAIPQ